MARQKPPPAPDAFQHAFDQGRNKLGLSCLDGIERNYRNGPLWFDYFGRREGGLTGPVSEGVALFDLARRRRYWLARRWDPSCYSLVCIGLNPSDAGAQHDDWTIARICAIARKWGYGGIIMVNAFSVIRTVPPPRFEHSDTDVLNDQAINFAVRPSTERMNGLGNLPAVLAMWGARCAAWRRAQLVGKVGAARWICLGVTRDGHPRHPRGVRGAGAFRWQEELLAIENRGRDLERVRA